MGKMKYMLNEKALDFVLPDQDNVPVRLSDFLGNWVLLYFYPKDDTPGCTTEACTLRDAYEDYTSAGVTILGVSTDSTTSHKKFKEKYKLPFSLLSDANKEVVNQYGVWGEKNFMGKTYMGINRTSFLINKEGVVVKVYEKVNPKDHAKEVLADILK